MMATENVLMFNRGSSHGYSKNMILLLTWATIKHWMWKNPTGEIGFLGYQHWFRYSGQKGTIYNWHIHFVL